MGRELYDYSDPTDYTYDSDVVTISGGQVSLRDLIAKYQSETNATCFNNYTTDENFIWSDGSATGTLAGGATVSGGSLDLTGGSKYCTYVAADNAIFAQTLTVRMLLTPGYTGSPAANVTMFSISDSSTLNNNIALIHLSAGTILFQVYNSAGSVIFNANLGAWVAANQEYEFEINLDITSGASRLFINGTQLGATQAATGTRTTAATELAIGANYDKSITSDISVSSIVVFSTVQHTTTYTPTDWSEIPTTQYSTTAQSIVFNTKVIMDEVISVECSGTATGSDMVKYIESKDGTDYYHNSTLWITSNGEYIQSNIYTEINTNASAFTETNTEVGITQYLYSADGSTTPTCTQFVIKFNVTGILTLGEFKETSTYLLNTSLFSNDTITRALLDEAEQAYLNVRGKEFKKITGDITDNAATVESVSDVDLQGVDKNQVVDGVGIKGKISDITDNKITIDDYAIATTSELEMFVYPEQAREVVAQITKYLRLEGVGDTTKKSESIEKHSWQNWGPMDTKSGLPKSITNRIRSYPRVREGQKTGKGYYQGKQEISPNDKDVIIIDNEVTVTK